MISRDEAYSIEFKVKQSLHEAKMELINKLYDSFEETLKERDSRICESCKYYSRGWCELLDVYFTKEFVCNKWEKKDDSSSKKNR